MRLAIVTDRIYPFFKGGAEKRYWDTARNLVKKGHSVHFYTAQWPGMKKEMKIEGIDIHSVYKVKNFYVKGRKSITESLKFSFGLLVPLLKGDYDLIDCESVPLLSIFPSKLVSLIKNKNLTVSWHEVWDKYWYEYLGKLGIIGRMVEHVSSTLPDKIISVSKHTTANLIAKLGVDASRIKTVPLGINLEEMQKIDVPKEKNKIIFVGRLISHKNVDLLLHAISILAKDTEAELTIAGNGPEKNNLKKLAKTLNLKVRFVSPKKRENLIKEIKSSSMLILPSSREGFGIVVLEAMACGVPVITVNHENNAAKVLVNNGKNGFVCKLDSKAIADKIKFLLKDDNCKNFEAECLKTSAKYSLENMNDKLEKIYLEMQK